MSVWILGKNYWRETPYSRCYRALDAKTGKLQSVEVIDVEACGPEVHGLEQAAMEAVEVSRALQEKYVPKQRQVVLYHDAELRTRPPSYAAAGGNAQSQAVSKEFWVWSEYISGGTLAAMVQLQSSARVRSAARGLERGAVPLRPPRGAPTHGLVARSQ